MTRKPSTTIRITEESRQELKSLAAQMRISQAAVMEIAVRNLATQEGTQTMPSIANSTSSVCNYCGAIYNAGYGAHICNVEELETLIDQERTMTDDPDERTIAKLESRIVEVNDFKKSHPNHQREVSHSISS